MRRIVLACLALAWVADARAQSPTPAGKSPVILFIGNSFTYGGSTRVHSYNAADVTDEPPGDQKVGGIPAIFKKFTDEAGLHYEVHVESVGGKDLAFHYEHAQSLLSGRRWDAVVLQGYSTEPLPAARGGNPDSFLRHADLLDKLIRIGNPAAKIYLYETWAYPFKTYPENTADPAQPLAAMTDDLRTGYADAFSALGTHSTVAPVGDAWMQAIHAGVASADATHPLKPGQIMLWDTDHKHPSVEGSYLAALVLFEKITGRDTRKLTADESAAHELGIPHEHTLKLQEIADAAARSDQP